MESLWENKPLLYSLGFSGGAIVMLAAGIVPAFAKQFEIEEFPPDVSHNIHFQSFHTCI